MTTGMRRVARGTRENKGRAGPFALARKKSFLLLCAMTAEAAVAAPAWSQMMTDPMRPPESIAGADNYDAAAAGGPVLQSVMISPAGSAAIISGEMVRVGQRIGDAVLVKVAESEVVLRSAGGTQVLKLYPGVEMRTSAPRRGSAGPARSRTAPSRLEEK